MHVSIPVAFFAGVISFLAPCVLPLLPAYVFYITGVSVKELNSKDSSKYKSRILRTSIMYVAGFSMIFIVLGVAAGGVGSIFREYNLQIQLMGGVLIIFLGMDFLGILKIGFLHRSSQLSIPPWADKLGDGKSFLIGVIFATSWTPCIGPVLGSILALAAVSGTVSSGVLLLFSYSLGICVPFLLVSLFLIRAPGHLRFLQSKSRLISKISGFILITLGLVLITNTYRYLNLWVSILFDSFGWMEYLVKNV